ncbi:Uncharacterized protein TCM_013706 [Theobroma cacao]|uniref:Uncharacterized protein n=1 Tax=Theobroma cacao TaxID=3641 RepID=A0A061G3V2_THECC|nr:Uncharacterized protein TCM_013706 [Theobroma cacao]
MARNLKSIKEERQGRIGHQTRLESCSMTFSSFSNEMDIFFSRNLDHRMIVQSLLS